jgi:hypothetical protein
MATNIAKNKAAVVAVGINVASIDASEVEPESRCPPEPGSCKLGVSRKIIVTG